MTPRALAIVVGASVIAGVLVLAHALAIAAWRLLS